MLCRGRPMAGWKPGRSQCECVSSGYVQCLRTWVWHTDPGRALGLLVEGCGALQVVKIALARAPPRACLPAAE